jgi:hypothetical protein
VGEERPEVAGVEMDLRCNRVSLWKAVNRLFCVCVRRGDGCGWVLPMAPRTRFGILL